jgi:hypothetical protein
MRQITPLLATLFLLATATPAGAAASHKKASLQCPRTHSRAVLADSQAEVYLAPEDPALPEFLDFYGCSYQGKRSYLLGNRPEYASSGGSGIELETLAGPMVAYEKSSASRYYGTTWLIVVRDLHSGKILHSVPTGTRSLPESPNTEGGPDYHDVGIGPAAAIVVKSDGAAAWIVQSGKEEGGYQVHAVDKTGSRVLAESPEIDPHSLALAGSTLYWTQGGKPMSSTLN